MLSSIRAFFDKREILEVDTPVLSSAAATDCHLSSFSSNYRGPGTADETTLYMQTSPEYAMKRLLAAGSGAIYQICKAFRNGEAGRLHNPEFTLLEWYRPGFSYHQLMTELEALLIPLLNCQPFQRIHYSALFQEYAGIDPFNASTTTLRAQLAEHERPAIDEMSRDDWLNLIMSQHIEPKLGLNEPVLVYDYPPSQAMLARIRPGTPPVAERFELYYRGVELANGFQELSNGKEQRQRFENELQRRHKMGLSTVPIDQRLIAALNHGLPDCAGVALGIDRLLMLIAQKESLSDVLTFPIERA